MGKDIVSGKVTDYEKELFRENKLLK